MGIKRQQSRMRVKCESLFARRVGAIQWSFLGLGSEKKWYFISEDSPQGEWDKIAEKMMLTFAESGHPVFRATSLLSTRQLKSKGGGKLSIHYCADQDTITTVLRTISFVNQPILKGAVAEMCEECDSCHKRTGRLFVERQSNSSFVPSVMRTQIPLTDDLAQEDLLKKCRERID